LVLYPRNVRTCGCVRLPKDDLEDFASWSSTPLVLLRDIHNGLLANYECKDTVPPQPQSDTRARVGRSSQDGDSQQQEAGPLLPKHTRISEAYHVCGEDDSNMTTIPSQHRVTMQILEHWQPFQDLKLTFAVSCRAEQLRLRMQQRIVATVEDSVRTEMGDLESQDHVPKRILWYKPMSWLGQIRSHRRDEVWSDIL
jgi:hypothetical protein